MVASGRGILRNVQRVTKLFVTKSVFAAFLVLVPAAALAGAAIALGNALVDPDDDRASGAATPAVRLGPGRAWRLTVGLYGLVLLLAFGTLLWLGAVAPGTGLAGAGGCGLIDDSRRAADAAFLPPPPERAGGTDHGQGPARGVAGEADGCGGLARIQRPPGLPQHRQQRLPALSRERTVGCRVPRQGGRQCGHTHRQGPGPARRSARAGPHRVSMLALLLASGVKTRYLSNNGRLKRWVTITVVGTDVPAAAIRPGGRAAKAIRDLPPSRLRLRDGDRHHLGWHLHTRSDVGAADPARGCDRGHQRARGAT